MKQQFNPMEEFFTHVKELIVQLPNRNFNWAFFNRNGEVCLCKNKPSIDEKNGMFVPDHNDSIYHFGPGRVVKNAMGLWQTSLSNINEEIMAREIKVNIFTNKFFDHYFNILEHDDFDAVKKYSINENGDIFYCVSDNNNTKDDDVYDILAYFLPNEYVKTERFHNYQEIIKELNSYSGTIKIFYNGYVTNQNKVLLQFPFIKRHGNLSFEEFTIQNFIDKFVNV